MSKSKFHPLTVWASTLGLLAGSQLVYAQEQAGQQEELVVKGFRSVIMKSQSMKMDNSSITEAITAEDIGKLPDTSIAESLARLPGLAGERREGRTSGLSVRGFSENYVGTTLNGRELLGMGDNRGVEYDLYPAEIISSVVVYKTPDATLTTQGIGGTVDLRTYRPLDNPRVIAINGTYEQNGLKSENPDFDDNGYRLSFTFSDQFLDDTLGVSLSVATMESPSQEQQFRGWGYASVNGDNIRSADNPEGSIVLADGVTATGGESVLGGHDSYVRSAMMERDSIAGVVQWEPTESLSVTFDALYIDFLEDKVFRGLEEAGAEWGAAGYTINEVEDGLVTEGAWHGFHSVIRNDAERKEAELTTFGLNVEYDINDAWSLGLDLSTGDVDKRITNAESYSGVGRSGTDTQGDAAARSWMMTSTGVMYGANPDYAMPDYTDADLIRLAGPQGWGGALAPIDEFQPSDGQPLGPATAQDGFVNNPDWEESLDAVRISVDGDVDFSIVNGLTFGLHYSDRSKTKTNRGAFLTAPTWPGDGPIPADYIVGTTDLGFIGLGEIIAYDSLSLFNSDYYTATDAARLETGRLGDTYTVNETVTTLYAMADLEAELGSVLMTGNVGVQIVDSEQDSTGYDTYIGEDLEVIATPVTGGDSYTKALPSLNLSFEVADGHYVRTALSKTISRPRMDDMRPNNQVAFSFNRAQILEESDVENSAWSGSSGNPDLRPLEANQFDLSYEWYFTDDGMLAATYFHKDLVNWHLNSRTTADFSSFYIPGYHQTDIGEPPVLFDGIVETRADGLTGYARGVELQASFPFHVVSDALDGLGLIVTSTFSEGELDDDQEEEYEVPGLSERVYQLTAYYEIGGFEVRVSGRKRSEYLSETRGNSLSLEPTIDEGAELWDAQIGYDFSDSGIRGLEGLSVTLQAQNFTDEDTVQADQDDSRFVTRYQNFGPNYLLGVNYKF